MDNLTHRGHQKHRRKRQLTCLMSFCKWMAGQRIINGQTLTKNYKGLDIVEVHNCSPPEETTPKRINPIQMIMLNIRLYILTCHDICTSYIHSMQYIFLIGFYCSKLFIHFSILYDVALWTLNNIFLLRFTIYIEMV